MALGTLGPQALICRGRTLLAAFNYKRAVHITLWPLLDQRLIPPGILLLHPVYSAVLQVDINFSFTGLNAVNGEL